MPSTIGYLIARFPLPSETFVYREVLGLQQLGLNPRIYVYDKPRQDELYKLPSEARDLAEQATLVPTVSISPALWRWLEGVTRGRLMSKYQNLISNGASKRLQATIPLRAAHLAEYMYRDGITHLHAHWPYATRVAHLSHEITGIPYSISVHAHEVAHDNAHFPAVFQKVKFAAFCNRAAMERVKEQIDPILHSKAHLIYHGVDTTAFSIQAWPGCQKQLRVVSSGRFAKTKGFDRLIRGCALARDQGVPIELTLIGDGALRPNLEALANRLGIAEHVTFTGWLSPDEVRTQLARHHLFALLADVNYHDGLPNVVLEAMSIGRPVVVSPLPAAHEAVTPGVTGIVLAGPDDLAGFVRTCKEAIAERQFLRRIGEAAAARIRGEHDATTHLQKLADLLCGRA